MINEKLVRATLWLSVPFNFAAAYAILIPGSWTGSLMGLPADVPLVYAALLGFMVCVFGCVYAWLAASSSINRPVLAIGTIGKSGVFVIVFALWLMGEATGATVAVTSGDLAFAAIWGFWLLRG